MNWAIRLSVSLALLGGVAACGQTQTDRALSGAGVGAAGGAVIGAVAGGIGALPGAAIGAGVGAAAGALTDDRDVNLGTPMWKW